MPRRGSRFIRPLRRNPRLKMPSKSGECLRGHFSWDHRSGVGQERKKPISLLNPEKKGVIPLQA